MNQIIPLLLHLFLLSVNAAAGISPLQLQCNEENVILSRNDSLLLDDLAALKGPDSIRVTILKYSKTIQVRAERLAWGVAADFVNDAGDFQHLEEWGTTIPTDDVDSLISPGFIRRQETATCRYWEDYPYPLTSYGVGDTPNGTGLPTKICTPGSISHALQSQVVRIAKVFLKHQAIKDLEKIQYQNRFTTVGFKYWDMERIPAIKQDCNERIDTWRTYKSWVIKKKFLTNISGDADTEKLPPIPTVEENTFITYRHRDKDWECFIKPCNLRAAHAMLDSIFQSRGIKISAKTNMKRLQSSLGAMIRNHWGLWSEETRLKPILARNGFNGYSDLIEYWHYEDDLPRKYLIESQNLSAVRASLFILNTYKKSRLLPEKGRDLLYKRWRDEECDNTHEDGSPTSWCREIR